MAGKADFLEEEWLNDFFRGTAYTVVDPAFIALFTVNPGEDGTGGTETAYTGYARVSVARGTGSWTDPSAGTQGEVDNINKLVFPVVNGSPGADIVGIGIYDAVSAGNLLYFGSFGATTLKTGNQPLFDIGALNVQED